MADCRRSTRLQVIECKLDARLRPDRNLGTPLLAQYFDSVFRNPGEGFFPLCPWDIFLRDRLGVCRKLAGARVTNFPVHHDSTTSTKVAYMITSVAQCKAGFFLWQLSLAISLSC
jgi:hypothetical protein